MAYTRPTSLAYTDNADANVLVAQDPIAFLIGWILDQQIKIQIAFQGPLRLRERIGTLDPRVIAEMPLVDLVHAFSEKPALHRYSKAMAERVQKCMQLVVDEYDGDAERIWKGVTDYRVLRKRIEALPGFGKMKATTVIAVLARRFGVAVSGFEDQLPPFGSLSEVVSYDDLLAYQARKNAYKKALRAAATA